jgi:hypothetical protein
MGAPNAPVDQLVGMMILKDGFGFSDEQLFEACFSDNSRWSWLL